MSAEQIRNSVEGVIGYFREHPEDALSSDSTATATIVDGLRCKIVGPNGASVYSDMVKAVGGEGSAPSPGWLFRAALASCDATMIAMRAAQLGVELSHLEVSVDSQSDDRGMLGMDDSIPAGPLSVRVVVRLKAEGFSDEKLYEIVEWVKAFSPVGDTVRRSVKSVTEVEII